jgi:hypothetical protein
LPRGILFFYSTGARHSGIAARRQSIIQNPTSAMLFGNCEAEKK